MRSTLVVAAVLAASFVSACNSTTVTMLGGGFRSYATIADVRDKIGQARLSKGWREERASLPSSDPRPGYEFLMLSGPLTLSGIDGNFKLVFYNGRLMSTEFTTSQGREFLAAMRNEGITVPTKPREKTILDRRTRFRYDVEPDGRLRFTWSDAKLEDEWFKWVANHS